MRFVKDAASLPLETPEIELLLSCARIRRDHEKDARVLALARAEINWDSLLRTALHHGVMPLLYHQLNTVCPEAVPGDFIEHLHNYFYLNAARNLLLTEELCRIVKLFEEEGIPVLSYKGPTLAASVYGELALRQFSDLDLMIHAGDIRRVSKLMIAQGYRIQFDLTPAQEASYLRSGCEILFSHEERQIFVDVHWSFLLGSFSPRLEMERFWRRSQSLALENTAIPTFSAEDMLIILCLHGGKELWAKLIWICDVAELIAAHEDELDWEKVMAEARTLGVLRMLRLGLYLAHDFLGMNVSDEILQGVRNDMALVKLAVRVRGRLFEDPAQTVNSFANFRLLLKLHDGFRNKLNYVWRSGITTNPSDWASLPLPDQLFPLYHLIRPIRLLIRRI